ncbi:MAG: rhodanese-like domain-containing protein [Xenophilus sp.]
MSIPASTAELSPRQLHTLLQQREEIAVLDVREVGLFTRGHLLHASSAPLWRIPLVLDRLVPRRDTPVVLTDLDGAQLAEAADQLRHLGYTNVSLLAGGTQAWQAAGYEVFIDDNVPGKALGEVVEVQAHTPHIDVEELRRRQARGDKLVVVDGRTPEEFRDFSLPGAHSLPNGELPYRIRELAPDPDTLIVVNCAGRTRSIIGAQTLIDAGVPNPVVSLKDGTMAWLLAGHTLEHGRRPILPEPTPQHLAAARAAAQALSRKAGVRSIDAQELARLAADGGRNLYRLDTRTREEYRAGHLPGWRWAPGGQLVQATDHYVGVRGARVVLADWDGVRAHSTAAWLAQLGAYEVVLYAPAADAALETGDEPVRVLRDPRVPPADWATPQQAWQLLQEGRAALFDVDNSLAFARRHIEGARFAAPHRVQEFITALAGPQQIVITSGDGVLARWVASRLQRQGITARALLGGNQAWFDAGLPTATGAEEVLTGEEDARYGGYAYSDPVRRDASFRDYLAWELALVGQVARPGGELPLRVLAA